MKYILKSKVGRQFFEYLVHEKKSPAIVILTGFPCKNNFDEIMYYLYGLGYNVFYPRYLGTFQSDGVFLQHDPAIDIVEFINFIKKGKAINLWNQSQTNFKNSSIILLSGSFGSTIAWRVANKTDVKKTMIFSPVLNYTDHNKFNNEQNLKDLTSFVSRAYTYLYRFEFEDIQIQMKKLGYDNNEEYNDSIHIFTFNEDHTTRSFHLDYAKIPHSPILNSHGLNLENLQNVINVIFDKT